MSTRKIGYLGAPSPTLWTDEGVGYADAMMEKWMGQGVRNSLTGFCGVCTALSFQVDGTVCIHASNANAVSFFEIGLAVSHTYDMP